MTHTKEEAGNGQERLPIDQLRERFRYDPETGEIFLKHSRKNGFDTSKPIGSLDIVNGYVRVEIDKKAIGAHIVAWALHYGEWPKSKLDHADRNRANNRIANLRPATNGQNSANSAPVGALRSKGVCWDRREGKYRAQIKSNGALRFLGNFDTEDEAAHAYNKAAIQHHGAFALLNPIGRDKQ